MKKGILPNTWIFQQDLRQNLLKPKLFLIKTLYVSCV
jgi:hypothetical protein